MLIRKLEGYRYAPTGIVFIFAFLEVLLAFYGWRFATDLIEALWIHISISLLIVFYCLLLRQSCPASASLALYVLCIVALGPLGVFGCGLTELVRWISSHSKTSFIEWYDRLFSRTDTDRAQALYELIEERGIGQNRMSTIAPFCDVLNHGSVTQKHSVVSLIADHFRPEFAPALQQALNDPEPAIRVQAATAAARIENTFHQQSILLREAYAKQRGNWSVARKIALHHESYARTGLLDPERAAIERKDALDLNITLLQVRPGDPDVTAAVARLLIELDRPQDAIRFLRPWLRAKSIPPALVSPMAEALFGAKRLRLLRRISPRLLTAPTMDGADGPLKASIGLWNSAHG